MGFRGMTRIGNKEFHWGERTYIMGILNVTPDSFSGDGLDGRPEVAIARAKEMVAQGADILDIGGESTRPGAAFVSVEEELRRVIPVLKEVTKEISIPISIDTYKSEVARQALDCGASIVNDVWGLKEDIGLASLAAERKVPIILMHNQKGAAYKDMMAEVLASLRWSVAQAIKAGVPAENIIIDPGIGFGKTVEHNLEIMRRLDEFLLLGYPLLLGTSRKSTIGKILDLPPDQRLEGTAATVAIGIAKGADIVRVHDVGPMMRVVRMSDAIVRSGG